MHYTCRTQVPGINDVSWQKYSDFTGNSEFATLCTPERNQLWPEWVVSYSKCPQNFDINSTCGSPYELKLDASGDHDNKNADI
jgi:hypothetical protein